MMHDYLINLMLIVPFIACLAGCTTCAIMTIKFVADGKLWYGAATAIGAVLLLAGIATAITSGF